MGKIYFKYGTMGAAKSAEALICKYRYEETGQQVLLLKPDKASRDDDKGITRVKSRLGISAAATSLEDFLAGNYINEAEYYDAIILDECQFATENQIDSLAKISDEIDVPIICYGLKTDYTRHLFPGSKRLLEIADSITEIKTVCKCGRKAIFNVKISGDDINGKYISCCRQCANNIGKKSMRISALTANYGYGSTIRFAITDIDELIKADVEMFIKKKHYESYIPDGGINNMLLEIESNNPAKGDTRLVYFFEGYEVIATYDENHYLSKMVHDFINKAKIIPANLSSMGDAEFQDSAIVKEYNKKNFVQ